VDRGAVSAVACLCGRAQSRAHKRTCGHACARALHPSPPRSLQTSLEVTKEEDWETILRQEEEEVEKLCADIIAVKPDIVFTEKGVSGGHGAGGRAAAAAAAL
jgi:hypothetical protein